MRESYAIMTRSQYDALPIAPTINEMTGGRIYREPSSEEPSIWQRVPHGLVVTSVQIAPDGMMGPSEPAADGSS